MAGTAVKPVTEVTPTNDENFAAAFAQIAGLDDGGSSEGAVEKKTEETPVVDGAAAAAAEAEAGKIPVVKEVAKPAEGEGLPTPEEEAARVATEAAAATAAAAAAAKEPPKKETPSEPSDDDLVRRLAGLVRNAPVEKTEATTRTEPESPYTTDELSFLENYTKDFPDVAKAEALIRRGEYQTIVQYVFQEITKELKPLAQQLRSLSERTQLGDIQAAVPDYNDLREKVIEWAGKQPAYLQPAYNHVIQNGTVDEVKDLIERYRTASGIKIVPEQVAEKTETELPAATKKAAAALAPVSSKRTAVVSTSSPDDFDGAFAEAAKTLVN